MANDDDDIGSAETELGDVDLAEVTGGYTAATWYSCRCGFVASTPALLEPHVRGCRIASHQG